MRVLSFLPAIMLALSVSAHAADPKPPAKPLPHTILVIDTAAGEVKFDVEVAADWRSQEYGLMNRKFLPRHTGMIFDFGSPSMTSFWMKNTLIPLDMLFIDEKGIVRKIHEGAKPHDETPLSSGGPVKSVLELNGGAVKARNIAVGNKVLSPQIGNAR